MHILVGNCSQPPSIVMTFKYKNGWKVIFGCVNGCLLYNWKTVTKMKVCDKKWYIKDL